MISAQAQSSSRIHTDCRFVAVTLVARACLQRSADGASLFSEEKAMPHANVLAREHVRAGHRVVGK